MSDMAELILARARALQLPMTEVARRAGLSRSFLYKLLDGTTPDPAVSTIYGLAHALQVSPIVFLRICGGHEKRSPPDGATLTARGQRDARDAVTFTADVTVPDHSHVYPGERFVKTWAIQNTGKVPWVKRYLQRVDEEIVIMRRRAAKLEPILDAHLATLENRVAVPSTRPGMPCQISIEFMAPRENCAVASLWRMTDEAGHFCYPPTFFLQVIVTVVGG